MKHEKMLELFTINPSECNTRGIDKYRETFAHTDRLANSAIAYRQRLLNAFEKQKKNCHNPTQHQPNNNLT